LDEAVKTALDCLVDHVLDTQQRQDTAHFSGLLLAESICFGVTGCLTPALQCRLTLGTGLGLTGCHAGCHRFGNAIELGACVSRINDKQGIGNQSNQAEDGSKGKLGGEQLHCSRLTPQT
jgi:hypothetical protein